MDDILTSMAGCLIPSYTGSVMYTIEEIQAGVQVTLSSPNRQVPSVLPWADIERIFDHARIHLHLTPTVVDNILAKPQNRDSSTMCALVVAMLGDRERLPTTTPLSTPSAQRYADALRSIRGLTDSHVQMLRVHYHASARTVTAKNLAAAVGYSSYSVANSQYGRLARLVGERLDYHPEPERLGTLVLFDKRRGEWHWLMRPEVAQALESLGWVEGANLLLPEEIAATTSIIEGAVCRVSVNAYERSPEARRRCIEYHGTDCCICGFSFGEVYGEVAEGYIHVHHLRPLSDIRGAYVIDPVEDLRPVCPNCHAVLHRRIPAFSIEEIRTLLRAGC